MKIYYWGEFWMIFVFFVGLDFFYKFYVCKINEIISISFIYICKRLFIVIKFALKKIGNVLLWYVCKLRIYMYFFFFGIVGFCSIIRI